MERSITLERIAGDNLRSMDENFLEGLAEAAKKFGLSNNEAKLVAFADGFAAAVDAQPGPEQEQAAIDEAREQGRQAGALSERKRICAIMSDPLAADRMDTARHLSFGTDMPSEQAIAFLKTVAPTTVAEAIQSLPANMARTYTSGGLLTFDAALGSIAPVETGSAPAGAALDFVLTPDPFARNNPKASAKASWKKVVGGLNAETDQSIRA